MEIILLEKIRHLGALGDTVKVKPGYGRNFLVPHGKAVYATKDNIAKFELRRAEWEVAAKARLVEAEARKATIDALKQVTIKAKTGEEGKLFGSIGTRDIADAITAAGVAIEKHEIDLPNGLIRQVGEYDLILELHSDVVAVIKVVIISEASA